MPQLMVEKNQLGEKKVRKYLHVGKGRIFAKQATDGELAQRKEKKTTTRGDECEAD